MPVATGFSCCDIISFPIESNIVIIGTSGLLRKADLTPDAQLSITRASLFEIVLRFFSKACLIISSAQHAMTTLARTSSFPHFSRRPLKDLIPAFPPVLQRLAHAPQLIIEIFWKSLKIYSISLTDFHSVFCIDCPHCTSANQRILVLQLCKLIRWF